MVGEHEEKKKKGFFKYIIIILIIVIAVCISVFHKSETPDVVKTTDDRLLGSWTTDGVTVYEFDGNGIGFMKVPSNEYKFTYVLHDNKIYIDFESEKATDSDYEYTIDGNTLTLKGIKSTTGEFKFTKQ